MYCAVCLPSKAYATVQTKQIYSPNAQNQSTEKKKKRSPTKRFLPFTSPPARSHARRARPVPTQTNKRTASDQHRRDNNPEKSRPISMAGGATVPQASPCIPGQHARGGGRGGQPAAGPRALHSEPDACSPRGARALALADRGERLLRPCQRRTASQLPVLKEKKREAVDVKRAH